MSTLQRAQHLTREVRHFHLFCGLGGGAKGFNRGHAHVGRTTARFRCIGGIDNDPAAIKDFSRLAGVEGTCLDLFSREQYIAFKLTARNGELADYLLMPECRWENSLQYGVNR